MGHSPPYRAVSNLAALTAKHWRDVRLKLLYAGVPDPMALPTMHRLLDATEQLITAGLDDATADELRAELYPPAAPAAGQPTPPPFTAAESAASFGLFAAAMAGIDA